MKYLLVLVVIVVFGWVMLRGRTRRVDSRNAAADRQAAVMVVCEHCGVHLPSTDALENRTGSYCSEAHMLAGPRPP